MSQKLCYTESVTLVKTTTGDYGGDQVVDETAVVPALIQQNTGFTHSNNQSGITSSTTVFVDPEDAFVIANWNRLEGMSVIVQLFGVGAGDAWFKVTEAIISRSTLLGNCMDNIQLQLKKSTEIVSVS